MNHYRSATLLCCSLALALTGYATTSSAIADDFYKGKTVSLIIGSGAGGGYDTYSRVLARHMSKHIPGKPKIVPQNMQGAASIKAANYLYKNAPQDGTVFGAVFNTLPVQPIIGRKGAKYDPKKFNWIGSIGKHQNLCATWHQSSVKSIDDAKKQRVVVAATSPASNSSIFPTFLNKSVGTKFKVITGYKTSAARLAVTRREADGICGLSYQTLLAAEPDWILKKQVNLLLQFGLKPHPDLKGVPMALDLLKSKADRDLLTFLMIPQEMGRPYVTGPNVPRQRTATLRTAFDKTMRDAEFKSAAKRVRMKIEPITGQAMHKLVVRLESMPRSTIKAAAQLLLKKKKKKK